MLYDRSKKLTEEQRTAYRNTRYEARLKNETAIIRVGMHCQILDSLCQEHAVSSWAFITACNPQSQELTDADNQHRQQLLKSLLVAGGYLHYAGSGVGESGDWPPEPSFLIMGMDRHKAMAYAQVFDQHAICYGEPGGKAQLLICSTANLT